MKTNNKKRKKNTYRITKISMKNILMAKAKSGNQDAKRFLKDILGITVRENNGKGNK